MSPHEPITARMMPSRRSVVRGAAWTVPVVATAATAPAFAASMIPCPSVPGSGQWSTTTASGSLAQKADPKDWTVAEDRWVVWQDSGTSGSATFTTVSPAIAVTAGATYAGTLDYWYQFGNRRQEQSSVGTFTMLINSEPVLTLSRSGAAETWSSRPFTWTAPAGTTSMRITYRYVVAARGSLPASDDLIVTVPRLGTCTRN